jgi:hypothetical protein
MASASEGTLTHRYPYQANAGWACPKGKGWGLAVPHLTSIHSHETRWKVPAYGSRARTAGTGEPTAGSRRRQLRRAGVARMPTLGRMAQEAKAWGNAQDMLTWARRDGRESGE